MSTELPVMSAQSWRGVWLAALTRPSLATYRRLVQQPKAAARQAYAWMFVGSLVGSLIVSVIPFFSQLIFAQDVDIVLLMALPLPSLLAVLYLALFAGCTQLLARLLKGAGTYQELVYAFASFSAPLIIVASLLTLIPKLEVVLIVLYIYWFVLYAMAVQAVHQLSRIRAVGAVLISFLFLSSVFVGVVFLAQYWGLIVL
jgi:Yip1-like protein